MRIAVNRTDRPVVAVPEAPGGRASHWTRESQAAPARPAVRPRAGAEAATTAPREALSRRAAVEVDDLDLMTVEEVCALLKVRKWFIYDAVSSGRLVGVKLGRALRFRRCDVAQYIDSGLTAAS